MKALESSLAIYLDELGITNALFRSLDAARGKLPVFLSKSYDIKGVHLFGKDFVLLLNRAKGSPTPAEALKHADMVKSRLSQSVIFVLTDLKSFERRRWVENGLAFIVPRKYFFFPMHLVEFREASRRQVLQDQGNGEALSASTQALLLAYLQHNPPCANLADWANYLHYASMTVSRARKELEVNKLCAVRRAGKSIALDFPRDRKSLWVQALPLLRSPVLRRKQIVIIDPSDLNLLRAGISALSDLSMLADEHISTYAMSSAAYKSAVEAGKIMGVEAGNGRNAWVEIWSYAPAVIAGDSEIVDRLSLYLSLTDSPDERVQSQLGVMMEEIQW